MGGGIPTPPIEDGHKSPVSRKTSSSTKHVKPQQHRGSASKRASTHSAMTHHEHVTHVSADGRHKRVWKACERCRMKKTKCDGEFPCKRCKDDGLVCTAGVRKKTEYKQLPRGYAEVLENTQFALIATVHKLYAMVRNSQQWDLGEPELNERGQPVIHDIASKLGCIRPNSDIDLPVQSIFPEDEAGLAELAHQLEEQQREQGLDKATTHHGADSASSCNRTDRDSSSEVDHSDFETDYRKAVFGGSNGAGAGDNALTMSPQSFAGYDFDADSTASPVSSSLATGMFPGQSPAMTSYPQWTTMRRPGGASTMLELSQQYLQQNNALVSMDMLNQGLLESEFGTIKPHVLSCPNPEVMMGMGDPMIYSGYEGEPMRL